MYAYSDPEYLKNQTVYKRSKPSDIYSLGVLFWEISSGIPPFKDMQPYEIPLKTIKGERETPVDGTPVDYKELYCNAWHHDPEQRQKIEDICLKLDNIQLEPVFNTPHENIQPKPDHINAETDLYIHDFVSTSDSIEKSVKSFSAENEPTAIEHDLGKDLSNGNEIIKDDNKPIQFHSRLAENEDTKRQSRIIPLLFLISVIIFDEFFIE
ncbi:145_t:CDS:2 [Acaulospora morrowiae]|uniref:145_t:CDS:1 n=1 Tax=Acaulospora morrowiae TaxID=94023 RepID=A0A9N8V5N9_9GLOM|nr:145_t:CDS:2 [Acaulospora morrowiae]